MYAASCARCRSSSASRRAVSSTLSYEDDAAVVVGRLASADDVSVSVSVARAVRCLRRDRSVAGSGVVSSSLGLLASEEADGALLAELLALAVASAGRCCPAGVTVTTISPCLCCAICTLLLAPKVEQVVVLSLENVFRRAEVTGLDTLYHRFPRARARACGAKQRGIGDGRRWVIRVERITM
ncbi:hypothetical protein BJV74DRAFT_813807 [Russula compacta]|nr:hypothetical protein BJV74DRAFT_813807 [Russula compacta]